MKLPVFKSVATTFAYFFTHLLHIIKAGWLPLLILFGIMAFVMPNYMDAIMAMSEISEDDPEAIMGLMGGLFKWMGILMLSWVVFYTIFAAGILKHLNRGETNSLPFYLKFGGDEIRIVITLILAFLAILGIYIAGSIVFTILMGVVSVVPSTFSTIVMAILGIIAFVGFIWFNLRLSLIMPAAITEKKLGIGPSWAASKGNTLQLFFYWLIIGIIMIAVSIAYMMLVNPDYIGQIFAMAEVTDPEELSRMNEEMMASNMAMWDLSSPAGILKFAGSYFGSILYYGFATVASGVAYRMTTEAKSDE